MLSCRLAVGQEALRQTLMISEAVPKEPHLLGLGSEAFIPWRDWKTQSSQPTGSGAESWCGPRRRWASPRLQPWEAAERPGQGAATSAAPTQRSASTHSKRQDNSLTSRGGGGGAVVARVVHSLK